MKRLLIWNRGESQFIFLIAEKSPLSKVTGFLFVKLDEFLNLYQINLKSKEVTRGT